MIHFYLILISTILSATAFAEVPSTELIPLNLTSRVSCGGSNSFKKENVSISVDKYEDGRVYAEQNFHEFLICETKFWVKLEITKGAGEGEYFFHLTEYTAIGGDLGLGIAEAGCKSNDLTKIPSCWATRTDISPKFLQISISMGPAIDP